MTKLIMKDSLTLPIVSLLKSLLYVTVSGSGTVPVLDAVTTVVQGGTVPNPQNAMTRQCSASMAFWGGSGSKSSDPCF
jgi:hypothetical protein